MPYYNSFQGKIRLLNREDKTAIAILGFVLLTLTVWSALLTELYIQNLPRVTISAFMTAHILLFVIGIFAIIYNQYRNPPKWVRAFIVATWFFGTYVLANFFIASADQFGYIADGLPWVYAQIPWAVFFCTFFVTFWLIVVRDEYRMGRVFLTLPMRLVLALLSGLSAALVCLHSGMPNEITALFAGVFALIGFLDWTQQLTITAMVSALVNTSLFEWKFDPGYIWFSPVLFFTLFIVGVKIFEEILSLKDWREENTQLSRT